MNLEWKMAAMADATYGIYLDKEGVSYPVAVIEFAPSLDRDNLERLFRAAPELLELCKKALFELEHAHSVADDWHDRADDGIKEQLNDMMPARVLSTIHKLTAVIAKVEGEEDG